MEMHFLRTVVGSIFGLICMSLIFHEVANAQKLSTNSQSVINIHFVPHTHNDVGWLKTVDQYYYGNNNTIQKACVECIIDSVIKALKRDPNRKFIYVETAFLWEWWQNKTYSQRMVLKKLVDKGQLEIIGGGWSMNDEAVTHYQSIIDQFTWGFRRLNDMFGPSIRPRIGWQIDPFGHSREQASMFAQMGFDGLFFARLDYQDKSKRLQDKNAEFVWRGSSSLGESSDLFTSVLFRHYSPPPGFCFDDLCHDEHISGENVRDKVSRLLEYVKNQAESYKTNNVLLTMGDDFHYSNAEAWFENIDGLIWYINQKEGTRFKAFYSTPSKYIEHLHEQNISWLKKSDDFFPFATSSDSYWTGYYTSRPTLKFFERLGNNFLQVLKQLSVLTNQPESEELNLFRQAMGTLQHHDAITGTERQHVAEDYEKTLYESFVNGEKIAESAMNKLTRKNNESELVRFHSCFLLNISSCDYSSENDKFVVTVYNPTSQPLTTYIRLPIKDLPFIVKDSNGKELITQIIPIPQRVIEISGRKSNAKSELVFEAQNVPALSCQSFYVSANEKESYDFTNIYSKTDNVNCIGGEKYNISIQSGGKVSVHFKKMNNQIDLQQSFRYYESHQYGTGKHSGAYVFRPQKNKSKKLSKKSNYQTFTGPLVEEFHQEINEWVSQVIKVYKDSDYVEFDWLVGPIPDRDYIGKEIITKYSSSLKNNGAFYTDSNGREIMKRKLNYRPTWDLKLDEPISGNYYPVTTKISIEDKTKNLRLSVLTDRAQGGSSLKDGEVELMLHRRLTQDDFFGLNEILKENAYGTGLVARGKHFLVGGSLKNKDELTSKEKELEMKLAMRPWIFITPTEHTFHEWNDSKKMMGDIIVGSHLPKEIRILTLEPWKAGEVLLRLEHIFEKDVTSKYSKPVLVNLKKMFPGIKIQLIGETVLGGNQFLKDVQRLKWRSESKGNKKLEKKKTPFRSKDPMVVALKPMEIKTFIIKLL